MRRVDQPASRSKLLIIRVLVPVVAMSLSASMLSFETATVRSAIASRGAFEALYNRVSNLRIAERTRMTESEGGKRPAKVFVSYTHESKAHMRRVLALAQRLRSDGIDAVLDQFVNGTPDVGWPLWMGREISEAHHVLIVCTATYYRRFNGEEKAGCGLGATWEGAVLVRQALYESGVTNTKYVPVCFQGADMSHVPPELRRSTVYFLPGRYQDLLRYLSRQPRVLPVELAPTVTLLPADDLGKGGTYCPAADQTPQRLVALNFSQTIIEAPSYSEHSVDIRFTISNLSAEMIKIGQMLWTVRARNKYLKIRLPQIGAPLTESRLFADISDQDEIDLLEQKDLQFILKPWESDAFRLNCVAQPGYEYECVLRVRVEHLEGNRTDQTWVDGEAIRLRFPIRSVKGLKLHQQDRL